VQNTPENAMRAQIVDAPLAQQNVSRAPRRMLALAGVASLGAMLLGGAQQSQATDGIGSLIDQQFQALGAAQATTRATTQSAPATTGTVQPPQIAPVVPQANVPAVPPQATGVRLPDAPPLPPQSPFTRQKAQQAAAAPTQHAAHTTIPQPQSSWTPRRVAQARVPAGDRDKAIDALNAVDGGDNARALRIIESTQNPVARAAAEYAWLRSSKSAVTVDRLARFLTQHPDFPQERLRRIFEQRILDEGPQAQSVLHLLNILPPTTGAGQLALAIAQDATGNRRAAAQTMRAAWRSGGLFGQRHEEAAMRRFGNVLTREDHKMRMDVLLYREDNTSGLRAAHYLGGAQKKLGEAWVAVDRRANNAGALLRAVPREARRDPAFAYIEGRWMRRNDQELNAARRFAEAPRQGTVDGDAWWIERRLVARHAIEKGQQKLAYQVASRHGAQKNSSFIEAEFHAGWIALRWLNDPRTAAQHFQRMVQAAARRFPTPAATTGLGAHILPWAIRAAPGRPIRQRPASPPPITASSP
jgi:soluble lytic murein transglycosylase